MIVAIDLGYGYTKAVSNKGKVVFPSAVSPSSDDDLGLGGSSPGYRVELRVSASVVKKRYFAGELALKRTRSAQMTLARDKFTRDSALLLTLTGAYLVGAEGRTGLAYGLPLAYYRSQKDEVRKHLSGFAAYISVNDGPERYIAFEDVVIFPQGVGALFGVDELPEEGIVGLVDIGFYTCDYLLVEVHRDGVEPYPAFSSSVELGVSTAIKEFAERFRRETGRPLSLVEAQGLWGKQHTTFYGRKMDLTQLLEEARNAAGSAIVEEVTAAWSEKLDFIDRIYLAGGGSMEFLPVLRQRLRKDVVLVKEPQFANALGFYRMAQRYLSADGRVSVEG